MTIIKKPDILYGIKWMILKENDRAYFKGYYEPEITKYLIDTLNKDSIFYDVGAHVGYFSVLASRICFEGKSYSFEPYPANVKFIKSIIDINNCSNWELVDKAISETHGSVVFEQGKTSSTGRICDSTSTGIEIETTTLDDFIEHEGELPDLVKIDVEGHGASVLRGFDIFKNSHKKIKILIELHDNSAELDYIKSNYKEGFKITDLSDESIDLSSENIPHHIIIEKE